MHFGPRVLSYTAPEGRLTLSVGGQGRPLLLIHGLSGSRRWWRYNLAALQTRRTVYVLELVGFGRARGQRPLAPDQSAELIARWLGSHAPCDVIGHSLGGHIALHLAASHPQLLRKLVLASPSGLEHPPLWRLALRLPQAAARGRPAFNPVIATDALTAGLPTLVRAARTLLSDDVSTLLPRIQTPTLLLWGGRDVLTPPALGRKLAHGLPNARLHLYPSAGHVVMVDAARRFNQDVLTFLDGSQGTVP